MRDKTETLECEAYAMSFAVLRISEMLACEHLRLEAATLIRIEAGPVRGWDDIVEIGQDGNRCHWQVKRQSTPLKKEVIRDLLKELWQDEKIQKGTLVLRAPIEIKDVGETRLYERIHERSSRVSDPRDRAYLANDMYDKELPWLEVLKASVRVSEPSANEPYVSICAIQLAARFNIHIAGEVSRVCDSALKNLAHVLEAPKLGFACLHSMLHMMPDASVGHSVESVGCILEEAGLEWRVEPRCMISAVAPLISDSVWERDIYVIPYLWTRTLWPRSDPVFVCDLYWPVAVAIEGKPTAPSISNLLKPGQKTAILGGAGSGKSTLLRHLWAREYLSRNRVPIYIETRSLKKGKSLRLACQERLFELGIRIEDDGTPNTDLVELLRTGNIVIMLDGLDEVGRGRAEELCMQLTGLCCLAPETPIVISARPHCADYIPNTFRRVGMVAIEGDAVRGYMEHILACMGSDEGEANGIWDNMNSQVQKVFSTPLLLNLYVIAVRSSPQQPPTSGLEAHQRIFELLYVGQDRLKGHERDTVVDMHWRDARTVFSRICLAMCGFGLVHDSVHFERCVSQVLAEQGVRGVQPVVLLEEISERTGLVIRCDEDYEFVHRSVQDYHAAFALASACPSDHARLATCLLGDPDEGPVHGAINFLRKIDRGVFRAHVELPLWRMAIRHVAEHGLDGVDAAISVFGGDTFFLQIRKGEFSWANNGWSQFHYCYAQWIQGYEVYSQVKMFGPGRDESHLISRRKIEDNWQEAFMTLDSENAMTNLGTLYRLGAVHRDLGRRYCDMLDIIYIRMGEIEAELD